MCIIKNQFISLIHFGQPSHRKKREKAILESNLDYQDEEDIEVGFTTTITPVKIKRKRNTNKIKSSNDYDELPKCQFHISETLPATVFSPKDLAKNHLPMHKVRSTKDPFLRALREVATEMELFLENHGQYIKKFVIKLIYVQIVHFAILQKNCVLKNMSKKKFHHIFLQKITPKHYFSK